MNKFYKLMAIALISCLISFSFNGCYGNFTLTKKLYAWNGQVGNKFVNSAVMWILFIIPAYEAAGAIDFVVLNLIQFWTGKNPMAMQEGESETQLVELNGKQYEITASKNRFDVRDVNKEFETVSLLYNTNSQSWVISDTQSSQIKVAQLDDENSNILHLYYPDGNVLDINLSSE